MKLGIVMNPIERIVPRKDSSLALLLAAQDRGWPLHYIEPSDLYLEDGAAAARMRRLRVRDDDARWFRFEGEAQRPLEWLDVVLMRVDPPLTMGYVHLTQILGYAERAGVLVVNSARGLREVHEKIFAGRFRSHAPATLVSRDRGRLREFLSKHGEIVLKPLDEMAGRGIFKLGQDDPNATVAMDALTAYGERCAMAQEYLPAIARMGDRRILLIDGEPVPYVLARFPARGQIRANLAAGGSYRGAELSAEERRLCARLQEPLRENGILFAGLDVIGGMLTEVNVTSPTGIRELEKLYSPGTAALLLDCIERKRDGG